MERQIVEDKRITDKKESQDDQEDTDDCQHPAYTEEEKHKRHHQ